MKTCKTEGCGKKHYARGFCNVCYGQLPDRKAKKVAYYLANQTKIKATTLARQRDNLEFKAYQRAWYVENRERLKTERKVRLSKTPQAGTAQCAAYRNRLRLVPSSGLESAYADGMPDWPCAQCGKTTEKNKSAVDHIIPLHWVDSDRSVATLLAERWCYQPLCKSCNGKSKNQVWCFVPTGEIGDECA